MTTELRIISRLSDSEIELYKALLRRDWAVQVLDADGRLRGYQPWAPYPNLGDATFSIFILHNKRFPNEDAARLAAAEAVWPELPESVRAELGERP